MTARAPAVVAAAAIAAGGAVGGAVRWGAAGALPEERASAAVVAVLGLALALGPGGASLRRGGVLVPAAAALASAVAILVAGGGISSLGAALVVAGVAALGVGGAAVARRCGASAGGAVLLGAALPAFLTAAVFLADPVIEWDGSRPESPGIARWVYAASPIAAATSPAGGTGVDWQTCRLLYDGHGAGGLSVIGQFYPTRPPAAAAWGVAALAAGAVLSLVGRRRQGAAAGRDSW